ncbi:hypothetical protein [Anatilimnocola floriformis]|uniref:hypothetical protein n=1 Tax=Anatilimnocola floriformis TaxID=2948575 RepID=UPI0020C573EE|nr:hypothetical protein [Anatilimnocola floriformis]
MKLTCPDCLKPVPAADVNIQLGVGKCLSCNSVFSLVDQAGRPIINLRSSLPIAAPRHWRVDDFGPDLSIGWRWYTHAIWFLVFFAIFWNGFLLAWYTFAIGAFLKGGGWFAVIPIVFPMLHLLAGIGMIYWILVTFINRTEVRIASGELSVYQGPLPTWGNKRISVFEISQLFVTEQCHHRDHGYAYSYNLNVLLNSGERMSLLSSISEPADALYLERTLEQRLQIVDQRVAGDWVG